MGAYWSGAQGEGLLQGEEVQEMSTRAATLRQEYHLKYCLPSSMLLFCTLIILLLALLYVW